MIVLRRCELFWSTLCARNAWWVGRTQIRLLIHVANRPISQACAFPSPFSVSMIDMGIFRQMTGADRTLA
jgi:hypothetical protein